MNELDLKTNGYVRLDKITKVKKEFKEVKDPSRQKKLGLDQ